MQTVLDLSPINGLPMDQIIDGATSETFLSGQTTVMKLENRYPLKCSIPMEKEQMKHLLVMQHLRSSPLLLILTR